MKQHEKEDSWEPSNKKIKLSPPAEDEPLNQHSSRQQVIVVLDQSVGSSKLYDFYQKTIDRDLQEIVILQFMKDFGKFINKNIMKSIPHVVSLEKMCRERSLIISLIQEGLLYESLNGSFHSVTQFFNKDREIKKMLFSKHAFETMEQYTTFIMKAINYDREGVIYDLVSDSLRDNLDFSLRATLICPKILYKYPERFLNLEFATNYSQREHPRSVMKIFLKDNDSPILEDKDFKKASEFHSDEGFGFMGGYKFKLENLKYLHLGYNKIDVEGFIELICNLPNNLTELDMNRNSFDSEYEIEQDLIPENNLQDLNLSRTNISNEQLLIISSKCKKLQKLTLNSGYRRAVNGIPEKALKNLSELWYLDISGINIMQFIPFIGGLDNIRTLILNNCRITSLTQFLDENNFKGLEQLSIKSNQLDNNTISSIMQHAKKRGIKVEIDANFFKAQRENQKQILTEMLDFHIDTFHVHEEPSDNLLQLLGKFDNITVDGFIPKIIESDPSEYLCKISSIRIYDGEIGDEGFRILFTNKVMHNLRELELGYNGIKEIPPHEECHSNLKTLTHLDLKYNLIGDEGVFNIVNNPYLLHLEFLSLEINGITKEGVKHIVSSPYMKHLGHLDLDGGGTSDREQYGIEKNNIEDEGFEILLNSNLNNLNSLCVSDNGLGNESAKTLANHKGVKNLVEIIMFENSFNDEAIPYLISPSIDKFQTLRILYNEISEEGQDEIVDNWNNLHFSI